MKDYNNMPQNSILINFGMDFIIEIVNLKFLKNVECFIPYRKLPEENHDKSFGDKNWFYSHFSYISLRKWNLC